ncbi:MAG: beta-ketoacyl-[acyl-carrier-protein] synthase family protein [Planctomycetota bacterium]|nr:beta-ketoacyl-[acyl-carrier-protein] synthase family protein [Planctomycetota bacterium]MDA1106402.1 beta-ketoacyl-[acyl-carrier-protein] synthase family protein [Planctomycetota bacterium]
MSAAPRIVVTGMGWITPLGNDIDTVWNRMMASDSGMAPITRFDARTFPTTFAAEVREPSIAPFVQDLSVHATAGLNSMFALGAAAQAWKMAGFAKTRPADARRVGLYLGAGEGVLDTINFFETNMASWDAATQRCDGRRWIEAAAGRLSATKEIEQEPNMPLAHIARELGIKGPAFNCLTACAASTQAIGEAYSIIQRGDADVMVAGGTHTMIHPLGVTGFNRLTALSTFKGDPTKASRPFAIDRDGFVMGEGSGMIVLETLEHALARGARPIAEVAGYGSSADAFRITDIQPEGRGAAAAMLQALAQAGIDPHQLREDGRAPIDYISAHGTGTKENDSIETVAVKRVFGELAPKIPMSSIKGMMGHLIAAAGAVEFMTCVLAIQRGMLPPTINHARPDPELDLDYVPNRARSAPVDICLSNSFGFGGQNDTVVVRRFKD